LTHVKEDMLMLSIAPTTRRSLTAALAALSAVVPMALVTPGSAEAAPTPGQYQVISCSDNSGAAMPIGDSAGGWTPAMTASTGNYGYANNCGTSGLYLWMSGSTSINRGESAMWTWTAPSGTSIAAFSAYYSSTTRASDGSNWGTFGLGGSQSGTIASDIGAGSVAGHWVTKTAMSDASVTAQISCAGTGASCPQYQTIANANILQAQITINDPDAPLTGNAAGAAISDTTWKASEPLTFTASDAGSGVARFRLYLDGAPAIDQIINDNAGRCVATDTGGILRYQYPHPCLTTVTPTQSIDTTTLADGQHTIAAKAVDASGRESTIYSASKLIANHPPVNTAVPAFVGAGAPANPLAGQPVSMSHHGSWSGPTLSYVEAWQRCDANGANCAQIPGTTSLVYTPTSDDIGHRLRYAVTASNPADSVTAYSIVTGVVTAPSSTDAPVVKPGDPTGGGASTATTVPGLPGGTTGHVDHLLIGHVAGEPAGTACPQDKATLVLQHIAGDTMKLRYGRAATAQLQLTCSTTGAAIADADLQIATKSGSRPVVASDVSTDGAGHATLRLAKGASRAITVAYRMYTDDPLARATATLTVLVTGKVSLTASKKYLHNGQAVTLRGALAGGLIPTRGVNLAVQWKDGKRWRPFAQIRTDRRGAYKYAYQFTRTTKKVVYRLRIQVSTGQLDYPFEATVSKTVGVSVAP
jgi:hypothetical protein